MEARNLAPLPGNVDFTVGASLPISGLTAWQGLFQHGRLQAGQSLLAHGAAGAVGSAVTQLAREFGAYVIGTGRAADRQAALDFGANEFLDLDHEDLDDVGGVDLVFDVIGGDIQRRSASIIRPGGTLVTVLGPAEARPVDGLAIDFVVESVPVNWWGSSTGYGTGAFARTSEPSRPSTTPSLRSTRPSGARARPSFACAPERPGIGQQRRHVRPGGVPPWAQNRTSRLGASAAAAAADSDRSRAFHLGPGATSSVGWWVWVHRGPCWPNSWVGPACRDRAVRPRAP